VENYYLIENSELKEYLEKKDDLKSTKLSNIGSVDEIIKELNEL
jgi:3-deoxy-D-manno-octulosonic-acid transferase